MRRQLQAPRRADHLPGKQIQQAFTLQITGCLAGVMRKVVLIHRSLARNHDLTTVDAGTAAGQPSLDIINAHQLAPGVHGNMHPHHESPDTIQDSRLVSTTAKNVPETPDKGFYGGFGSPSGRAGRAEKMREPLENLRKALATGGADTRSHEILTYMVTKTLEQLDRDPESGAPTFTRVNFLNGCAPASERDLDPNKWAPTAAVLRGALQRMQNSLPPPHLQLHEQKGGGRGNSTRYALELAEMPDDADTSEQAMNPLDIAYHQSRPGEVQPVWLLRWLFCNGKLKMRTSRGCLLLFGLSLLTILWLVLAVGVVFSHAWLNNHALSLQQLLQLVLVLGSGWFVWQVALLPWWQLILHRIVMAPTISAAAITEDPCQLELYRSKDQLKWIRLVRYTADCPLCSGKVELASGRPEHRLPLVGRCMESPHYHVFTFDRTLCRGTYIGPPLPGSLRAEQ